MQQEFAAYLKCGRMELLSSRLVVQLSSMLVIGFELTIAALKYFLN